MYVFEPVYPRRKSGRTHVRARMCVMDERGTPLMGRLFVHVCLTEETYTVSDSVHVKQTRSTQYYILHPTDTHSAVSWYNC